MAPRESRRTHGRARVTSSPAAAFVALALALAMALALALATRTLAAQQQPRLDLGAAVLANGEELRVLRALALLDSTPGASFLIQPFATRGESRLRQVARSDGNPWLARFSSERPRQLGELAWRVLRPDALLQYHSALPTADPAGAAWAGRGATVSLQAGVLLEWRFLRAQLAPLLFQAQNADFALAPNGRSGPLAYADSRFPTNIDYPQRFGDGAYGRFDWGDTFIEASGFGLSAGLSNARQHWGPAREYPLLLGTGSGGFGHGFVGSAAPIDLRIGHLQSRLIAGRLEQSAYSSVSGAASARFLVGFVGSFAPRFAPGVEVGGMRLINGPWPAGGLGLDQLALPFQGVLNDNVSVINQNEDNQFAGAFLRIAPPGSGFEAYAELSREDFAGNARLLIEEPDDLVDYVLGVSQARRGDDGALRVLRAEFVNGELSHMERGARTLRQPYPPYTHSRTRQGLTNRGQLLGSPAAYGGAGGTVAYDRYDARGRLTVAAERMMALDWLPALGATGGVPHAEVRYGLRVELHRFRGNGDWTATLAPSYTLNRNLERGRDLFDLMLGMRWRGW